MLSQSITKQQDLETLPGPYLLFLGDTTEPGYAKTAYGLRDWAPERCIGEFFCEGATVTTGLRFLTPAQAAAAGAKSLVIGVANAGGVVAESWLAVPGSGNGSGPGYHQRHAHAPRRHCSAEDDGRAARDAA